MSQEHFDVIIVGAGISGIGAGCHLKERCPDRTFAILEGREQIGGTWDLFRYPGIRSDSDMHTLGYRFRPWTHEKAIADGPSILEYLADTVQEHGLEDDIRFGQHVKRASWSSSDARWTVEVEQGPDRQPAEFTCSFLFTCSGYYNYEAGYTPDFPGIERFAGRVVHPQKWTEDIEYAGQRVIVIGSGATAVTIVPEMSKEAAQVTMLQRSPTYVVSRPAADGVANWLRGHLPEKLAYGITRWKNVIFQQFFFNLARKRPRRVKEMLTKAVQDALGPDYDVATHFTPSYDPWDQRLCLVPDGDLFEAIREGRADVVTDHIDTFTEKGILLKSGRELEADLIVTATGLDLQLLGGMELVVDGRKVDLAESMSYKGMMFSDIPNLANSIGYTNASWTLKADLTCEYVCRLLNHMKSGGYEQCTPRLNDPEVGEEPWADFSSGYVQRSLHKFPKNGSKKPWRMNHNYGRDLVGLRFGQVEDGAMEFRARNRAGEERVAAGQPEGDPASA